MKKASLYRWFHNTSIDNKLFFIVGAMALFIAVELFMLFFSFNTLCSVRALVVAEGLLSKSRADATRQLVKYAHTRNEGDYRQFHQYMKVPSVFTKPS